MDEMVTRWEAEMATQVRSSTLRHQAWKKKYESSSGISPGYPSLTEDGHPVPAQAEVMASLHRLTGRKTLDDQVIAELGVIYTTAATLRAKLCAITVAGRSYLRRVQAEKLSRHASHPLVRSLNKAILWERRRGDGLVSMLRPT